MSKIEQRGGTKPQPKESNSPDRARYLKYATLCVGLALGGYGIKSINNVVVTASDIEKQLNETSPLPINQVEFTSLQREVNEFDRCAAIITAPDKQKKIEGVRGQVHEQAAIYQKRSAESERLWRESGYNDGGWGPYALVGGILVTFAASSALLNSKQKKPPSFRRS